MAYEVYEHAGAFVILNRHTGEGKGLVTPIVEGVGPEDQDAPRKLGEAGAFEAARRFPSRKDAEDWLATAF